MLRLPLLYLAVLISPASAQFTRLTFRPIEAEYSTALDRLVMITTSPNQLRIYDAANRTEQTVALSSVPLSLSLSPNGRFAAVGHDGTISYINLAAAALDRIYTVTGQVSRVVLGTDWVHAVGTTRFSVRLSTGAVTTVPGSYAPTPAARLHPQEKSIYALAPFGSPLFSYDVSSGAQSQAVNLSTGPVLCPPLWHSQDGTKIYTGCATVHRYADRADNTSMLAAIPGLSRIAGLAESAALNRLAVIPPSSSSSFTALDGSVRLYDASLSQELGRFQLSSFAVAGTTHAPHGRWVFFNAAGTTMHVLSQADGASGLLNDFALQSFALTNPGPCFATFASTTISVPPSGLLQPVQITAPAECVFQASTATPWIQLISGGFGSGSGPLVFHARANTSATARSGSITMGTQTLTVTQAGTPSAVPNVQRLSYKVVDAEYSKDLDRIVFVTSGPNELHLYDPITRNDQFVPLAAEPLAVSLHPNGLTAAVGHSGSIALVNLQTLAVDRVLSLPGEASDLVLTASGWVYAASIRNSTLYSVQISNNAVTGLPTFYGATGMRLYSTGNYLYAASGSVIKFDIRSGVAAAATFGNSPPSTCGNLWLSEDGQRMFTKCGAVYRTSETPSQDFVPNGSFSAATGSFGSVGWVAHSAQRASAALVRALEFFSGSDLQNDIQLYSDDGLLLQGRLALTPFSDNVGVYGVYGRYVFWNKAANRLFAVNQVSSSAGVLSDFLVEVFPVDAFSACAVTLPVTSADVSASGGEVTVAVTTGPGCIWNASTNDFSVLNFVSGSAGSGTGSLKIGVFQNSSSVPRTGTVVIGGVTFTVRQAASSGIFLLPAFTAFMAAGGPGSVLVSTNSPTLAWTASATVPWINITQPSSGVGPRLLTYTVAPNPGAARRGRIMVGAESFEITQAADGFKFVPVAPCRVVDTRGETGQTGAFGTPVMAAGSQRDFPIPQGTCNIPAAATAYSFNVTVVPRGPLSFLTLWPAGSTRPLVSTLNSFDGRIKANAAIVPAGTAGAVSVYVTDATEVVLDINGYFVPESAAPLTSYFLRTVNPCRVVDTRLASGVNGGPSMTAGQTRSFSFASGPCGALSGAAAYSLNITAIPKGGGLSYLTAWPTGTSRPFVSTLNAFTGAITANAAIVPTGTNGEISVFVTDAADVVIDINGYFTAAPGPNLKFYPLTPCRVSDTRNSVGPYGGPILAGQQSRAILIPSGNCGVAFSAFAYVLNATVVPSAGLSFLTVFPFGQAQPLVSTLNAFDGSVTSNALITPAGTGGVTAYVTDATHLILDTSGYFAP